MRKNDDASARAVALMNQVIDVFQRAQRAPDSPVTTYAPAKLRRELRREAARLRQGKAEPRYKNLHTAEGLADIYERTVQRDELVEQTRKELRRIDLQLRRLVQENGPEVLKAIGEFALETQRLADENGPGSEAAQRYRQLQYVAWRGRHRSDRRRQRTPAPPRLHLTRDPSVEERYEMSAAETLPSPPSSGETVISIPPEGGGAGRGRIFLRIGIRERSWIGSFECGRRGSGSMTFMMPDAEHLFVSAGGAGYLIDARSRTLVETIGTEIVDVLVNDPMTLVVVNHDDLRLEAFGETGRLWKTDRIGGGGFRRLELTDEAIAGEARHPCWPGWVGFSVNLATGEVHLGNVVSVGWSLR